MKKLLLSLFLFCSAVYAIDYSQKQTIESASELDYPPFSIVDKDDNADGFSVELMRAALKTMGRDVSFRVGEWSVIKNDLARGKIDALPVVGRTPERGEIFDFTIPYMQLFGALIVRSDNNDIKGIEDAKSKELIVMKGDNAEEFVRRNAITQKIITTPSYEDALRLLSSGKGDAVLVLHLVGSQLMEKLKLKNLKMVEKQIASFRQDLSFAVKSDNKELLALLNEGLANTKADGSYDRLYRKWFNDPYKYTIESLYWIAIGAFLSVIVIVALIVLMLFSRRLLYSRNQLQIEVDTSTVKLIDTARRLRMLSDCNQTLLYAKSEEALLQESCKILHEGGGYPVVWAGYVDPKNPDIITPKASRGIGIESVLNIWQMKDEPSCALYRSIHERKPQVVQTREIPTKCPVWHQLPESMKKGTSILSIPLLAAANLFGVLVICSVEGAEHAFDQHEIDMLMELSSDIAFGIQNLKRAQRELELSELNRLLLESAGEGIFGIDKDGKISLVNSAAAAMLGYDKSELIGADKHNLFHYKKSDGSPYPLEECPAHLTLKDGKQRRRDDEYFFRKDGTSFPVEYTCNPIIRDGEIIGVVNVFRDTSETRRAYEALLESKAKFKNMVETISDVIWEVDANGVFTYVSPQTKELLGFEQYELLGKTLFCLMSEDEAGRVKAEFEEYVRNKTPFRELVNRCTHKNGHEVILETSGNPILDEHGNLLGYRGVDRDITRKMKYEESLRRYQLIVDTSNDPMSMLDKNYVYRAVNQSYMEMWNKSRDEIVGHSAVELMGEEVFAEKLKPNLDRCLMGGEHVSYQAWFGYAADKHYMDVHYYPYKNHSGGVDGVVVNVHDLTELKNMEESMKQKDELMIAHSRQAAMGEMIGMIAHQWRQPISTIAMAINNLKADIALDMFKIEEADKKYDEINDMVMFLSQTIDDFRDFFRTEKGKESVSLDEIVDSVLKILGKSLENNGIEVALELNAPERLQLYKREMIQVFLNILQNSKDALTERKIAEPKIIIKTYIKANEAVAEFCDNGGGIEQDIMDRIYEPYFTTKGPSSGTGLGLYMSKMIVQQHHKGEIVARNIEGGVCFTIVVRGA